MRAATGENDVVASDVLIEQAQENCMEQFRGMAMLAQQGNEHAIARLKAELDADSKLWEECGDLAKIAETTWINLITKQNFILQEALTRTVVRMKDELTGPAPSALETPLV